MVTTISDPCSLSEYEYADNFLGALNQSSDLYETVRLGNYNKFYCKAEGCDKVFFFKSAVERHVSSHLEIKPYKCTFPYCGKAFKREDSLENHIRGNHTKEPALTCTFPGCKEYFTTNAKLRYHTLLHTGKRPYKCSIPNCGRSFVTSSQLRQHERSFIVHKKLMRKNGQDQSPSDDKSMDSFGYDEKMLSFDESPVKKMKVEQSYSSSQEQTFDEPSFDNWNDGFLRIDEPQPQVKPQAQPPMNPETEALLSKVMRENESLKSKIQEAGSFLEKINKQYNQLELALNQSRQQLMSVQCNNPNYIKFENSFALPELNFPEFKHNVYNS